jgi:PA domain
MAVGRGEVVVIRDEKFGRYVSADSGLFHWEGGEVTSFDEVLVEISLREGVWRTVLVVPAPDSGEIPFDSRSFDFSSDEDNEFGCEEYTTRRSGAVVVKRGECPFQEKMLRAKEAGYKFVFVLNTPEYGGEKITPIVSPVKGKLDPVETIPLVLVFGEDVRLVEQAVEGRLAGRQARQFRLIIHGGITPQGEHTDIETVSNVIVEIS